MIKYRATVYYDCATILDRIPISQNDYLRLTSQFADKDYECHEYDLLIDNYQEHISCYKKYGYLVLLSRIVCDEIIYHEV